MWQLAWIFHEELQNVDGYEKANNNIQLWQRAWEEVLLKWRACLYLNCFWDAAQFGVVLFLKTHLIWRKRTTSMRCVLQISMYYLFSDRTTSWSQKRNQATWITFLSQKTSVLFYDHFQTFGCACQYIRPAHRSHPKSYNHILFSARVDVLKTCQLYSPYNPLQVCQLSVGWSERILGCEGF